MTDPASAAEAKAAGMMTDEFLLRAFERTKGEPGDVEADARGLDV